MNTCTHFSQCGGCKWQDIVYHEQLNRKEARLKELLSSFNLNVPLKPINHYKPWFYRNKMEYTFQDDEQGNLICGLHRKIHKRKVFALNECLIFSPDVTHIVDVLRQFFGTKYRSYNTFIHRGFLRHLIVRETKFTHQMMIGIVTTSSEQLDKEGLLEVLLALKLHSQIKSVYWIINDSKGDAVVFQKKELIYGDEFITERLDNLSFRIYIDSFFQTNSFGIVDLYHKIKEYTSLQGKENVLDLYCGVGSIGLFLAPQCRFVWGVELQKEIVNNAFINAKLNNIDNIVFIAEDVRKFLIHDDIPAPEVVIINPPRCGLSKKVTQRILSAHPPVIFYSSCNPETFCSDLKCLSSQYKIEFIEPFDFFPHTPHMESLARLTRKAIFA